MRVPLGQLTDDQIRAADVVAAVDPRRESFYQQVYGHESVPPIRPYPSGPGTLAVLEVEIDSSNEQPFQELLQRVARVKLYPLVGYLHREFDLSEGDVVEVTLSGNAANVLLLDESNFQNYLQGLPYNYNGGYARTSPYSIEVPRAGRWHLVVDLGGGPGRVQASVRVISGAMS